MAARLKKDFVKLLERDEEFRYAVVGYLGLADISKSLAKLVEVQAKAEERLTRLEASFRELARQVGKLSDTISFGLEDIARVVLPGWLSRHEGIEVDELTRTFFEVEGEVVEINLYGEGVKGGERVVVLGESRSRIYEHDVKEFDELAEKVKTVISHKVYKLLFGYWIHPKAQREAANRGLTLIASYMR